MTEVAGTAGKRTQDPVPALQLVGVFAAAEVVDEVAQLVHVLQALRHDHLLVDQVRLRQVGAGLGSINTTNNKSYQTPPEEFNMPPSEPSGMEDPNCQNEKLINK